MVREIQKPVLIAVALLAVGLLIFVAIQRNNVREGSADLLAGADTAEHREFAGASDQFVERNPDTDATSSHRAVRVQPGQVLASVNGREVKVSDLIPLKDAQRETEQILSRESYEFLLDRAVNRELILQMASSRRIELSESQKQQLEKMKALRGQPGPGLVRNLNVDPVQLEFELRDAEAFLLQTTLLAAVGANPNVTSEQVQAYFQQHAPEFGPLPAETEARQEAWERIEIQIRQQLASGVRSSYHQQLTSFMSQAKATAEIVVHPLPDSILAQ